MSLMGNPGKMVGPLRPLQESELEDAPPEQTINAIPAHCRRVMNSFSIECSDLCEGAQKDGSCLLSKIRGRESWQFELDRDGYWELVG